MYTPYTFVTFVIFFSLVENFDKIHLDPCSTGIFKMATDLITLVSEIYTLKAFSPKLGSFTTLIIGYYYNY